MGTGIIRVIFENYNMTWYCYELKSKNLELCIQKFDTYKEWMKYRIAETMKCIREREREREREWEGPLEKGTMWSYSKQRQPWQLQKRLQTMLPAASLRHLSGCLPGTISAFAQHLFFAFESKNRGLSSPLLFLLWPRERWGDEDEEEVLILGSHPRSLVLLSTLLGERDTGARKREKDQERSIICLS